MINETIIARDIDPLRARMLTLFLKRIMDNHSGPETNRPVHAYCISRMILLLTGQWWWIDSVW
jgi:hypothetical protein